MHGATASVVRSLAKHPCYFLGAFPNNCTFRNVVSKDSAIVLLTLYASRS